MRRPGHAKTGEPVDLTTHVGSLTLPNPIMSASGTAGHGAELARYFDLSPLTAWTRIGQRWKRPSELWTRTV